MRSLCRGRTLLWPATVLGISSANCSKREYTRWPMRHRTRQRFVAQLFRAYILQYKAKDTAAESEFSSISDLDPLGTSNSLLPGQVKALGVALETDGYRLGFPKGSHCDEKNRGGGWGPSLASTTSCREHMLPPGTFPVHAQYRSQHGRRRLVLFSG